MRGEHPGDMSEPPKMGREKNGVQGMRGPVGMYQLGCRRPVGLVSHLLSL